MSQHRNNYTSTINKLFVAYKPSGMSSNQFLSRIKRKYNTKKAGYSGTLDPFAKGVLIVALGSHTKLFRFLDKAPKRYRATLWLGTQSDTLDIEGINSKNITNVANVSIEDINEALKSLEGELTYAPPLYSAKSIEGKRAYDLARAGISFELKKITSHIYETKLIHYCHPFLTFEVSVSEGTYVRSLGNLLAEKLNCHFGALTALERLNEGKFCYNNENACNIKNSLVPKQIKYRGELSKLFYGQPLDINDFVFEAHLVEGTYWIDTHEVEPNTISIVQIENEKVSYLLNKVNVC